MASRIHFRIVGLEGDVLRCSSAGLARIVVPILLMVILSAASGPGLQTPHSPAQGKFAQAADRVFREGVSAHLPPHISVLLGLSSKEEECLVIQGVERTEKLVQGFDISFANKDDVVLFVVNETTQEQALYLTSPRGSLRKVVVVKAGVGNEQRITDKERKAFQKEKQFWVDHLVPASASPGGPGF
jgi:hypothetical protein